MMSSRRRVLLLVSVAAVHEAVSRPVVYIHQSLLLSNSTVLCIAEIDTPEYKAAQAVDEEGRARFFFDGDERPSMPVTVACQGNDGIILASSKESLTTRLRASKLCPAVGFHAGFFSGASAIYKSECNHTRLPCTSNDDKAQQPLATTVTTWIQIIGDSVIATMYCRWRWELYGRVTPFRCDRKSNSAFTRRGSVVISFHRLPGTGGNDAANFEDELKMSLEGPNKFHMQWWVDTTSATFETVFNKPISNSEKGKRPTRTFFTIGCHYSTWSIGDWLKASSALFRRLMDVDSAPNRWIYMLNPPPLTSLIPKRYSDQKTTRTMLVNYWKNRQVLFAAKEHRNAISMADFATSELYWNERGAHIDAVHVVNNVSTDMFPQRQVLDAMFSEMCQSSY